MTDPFRRSPRRGAFLVATACVALAAEACGGAPPKSEARLEAGTPLELRSDGGLATATVEAENGHLAQGKNALRVQFDRADVALDAASAFMPVHGHPAPAPSVTRASSYYRVTDLIFTMPGLWDVTLDISEGSKTDEMVFSVDVP